MKIQQQIPLQNYCPHLFSDRWGAACGGTLISYTSFEQPNTLTESPCQATFKYNTEGQRASMVVTQNGSNRGFPPTGERVGGFWIGGDAFTAPCVVAKTGDTTNWYYVLRDHLGTITHVTNASGTVQNQYSFDAWGRRRNFSNWGYTVATQTDLLPSRCFTSHEWLPWFNLYNMNGRLYDPVVGRFLSPDPIVQNPAYSQNLNRYSYVLNNPLRYNDPSGLRIQPAPGEETYINPDAQRIINNFGIPGKYYQLRNLGFIIREQTAWAGVDNTMAYKGSLFKPYVIKDNSWDIKLFPGGQNAQGQGGMPGWAADVNTGIGAFNAANGLKSELIEYAVRSNYKSARTWSEFNNLRSSQQAWRTTNTLGKTGASYLKYAKGLGYVGAGLTTTYSAANAGMYYYNGGTDWQVGTKATLDVIMTGVGFLGPIGFGISASYFILDAATGGFGGFGQVKP